MSCSSRFCKLVKNSRQDLLVYHSNPKIENANLALSLAIFGLGIWCWWELSLSNANLL